MCQAPYWGCLKTAKSRALVVLTEDSALFSLQLVLWQVSASASEFPFLWGEIPVLSSPSLAFSVPVLAPVLDLCSR